MAFTTARDQKCLQHVGWTRSTWLTVRVWGLSQDPGKLDHQDRLRGAISARSAGIMLALADLAGESDPGVNAGDYPGMNRLHARRRQQDLKKKWKWDNQGLT